MRLPNINALQGAVLIPTQAIITEACRVFHDICLEA